MFANGLCRVNDCGSEPKFNLAANGRRFCAARENGPRPSAISGDVCYCTATSGRGPPTPLAWADEVIEPIRREFIAPPRDVFIVRARAVWGLAPLGHLLSGVRRNIIPRLFHVPGKPIQSVMSFCCHARVERCRYLLSFDTGVSDGPVVSVDQIGLIKNVGDRTKVGLCNELRGCPLHHRARGEIHVASHNWLA